MKKTIQTMVTAAMFAATVNMIPSGTSAGTSSASAVDYNPATENWQNVYGPPPVTTIKETTQLQPVYGTVPYQTVETTPVTTNFDPEKMTTVAVYGPPIAWNTTTEPVPSPTGPTIPAPLYGPPIAWVGDLNFDNRVDVFDMIELRKAYIDGVSGSDWLDMYRADVNGDGSIGISDLVMLQNYILGKIDNFNEKLPEPKSTTATQVSHEPVQTATEPVPQPEYGAPIAFFE